MVERHAITPCCKYWPPYEGEGSPRWSHDSSFTVHRSWEEKNIRHLVTRSNILFYNYLLPIIDRTRSIMRISVFSISHFRFIHFEDWINRFSKLSRDTIRWNIYIDNIHRFARSFFQRGGPSWTTKTGSKKRIETQTNQRARWNERRTYAKMLDVPLTPNPRHVVYFIALLALLHQFPSVYTSSPAVVTALSLSPSPSLPLALSREHHSTRIKYWLRFWFIVIAGGIARGSEAKPVRFERDGAIEARGGRKRRRRRRRVDSAEGGWSPLPVSGGVWRRGDDGHGGGGWEESHSIADRCICQSVADVSASFYVVTRLVVIIAHFYFLAAVTPPRGKS